MSMMHPAEIECPECGAKSFFTIHDSINVTLDPEDKKKVLDKSLFLFHCEKCGTEAYINYDPLYHDMTEKYMIMVVPDQETARKTTIPEMESGKFSMLADGYRFRVVCGISGLIEKITIFDYGLSDYAVELLKAKYFPIWAVRRKYILRKSLKTRFVLMCYTKIQQGTRESAWSGIGMACVLRPCKGKTLIPKPSV